MFADFFSLCQVCFVSLTVFFFPFVRCALSASPPNNQKPYQQTHIFPARVGPKPACLGMAAGKKRKKPAGKKREKSAGKKREESSGKTREESAGKKREEESAGKKREKSAKRSAGSNREVLEMRKLDCAQGSTLTFRLELDTAWVQRMGRGCVSGAERQQRLFYPGPPSARFLWCAMLRRLAAMSTQVCLFVSW
jgi:hypothetical protein